MSVLATMAGGRSCRVPVDGVETFGALLATVHAAMGLPLPPCEYELLCIDRGVEVTYHHDSSAPIGCAGTSEEDLEIQLLGASAARGALKERGLHNDGANATKDLFREACVGSSQDPDVAEWLARSGWLSLDVMLMNVPVWGSSPEQAAAAKLLLRLGAAADEALLQAANLGRAGLVQLLLDHGADTERTQNGMTALLHAAMANHAETCDVLLSAGADANLKNKIGLSARDFAEITGGDAIRAVFAAHGHRQAVPEQARRCLVQ